MTKKDIIHLMLRGYYLKKWKNYRDRNCFRLYDPKASPVENVSLGVVKSIDDKITVPKGKKLWIINKKTKAMTFNLSVIRQLHGRTVLKKQYQQLKKKVS